MPAFKPPFFGAAYYPEAWPLSQMEQDIRSMLDHGINTVRIGEFAWSCMEPSDGHYQLEWLHQSVKKLGEAGIAVILCTPTCTPPIWLSHQHEEILVMDDQGRRAQHGARRHACPNSPVYRAYAQRIVERLAREFAAYDHIVGWQIDNELYPVGRGCCCPVCRMKFLEAMRERFYTVEAMSEAWCLNLWSQAYERFEQLEVPRADTWAHPSLVKAWMDFQSDSYAGFARWQSEILRRFVSVPIGSDMMPMLGLSYRETHKTLDLVQFNHYPTQAELWKSMFWMDYVKTIVDAPFWVTETHTGWNGSASVHTGYKQPGFCRVNSWLPFAFGGQANLYWLWRAHRSGQELMHGSVIDSAGRPLHLSDEVKEVAAGLEKAASFLNSSKVMKADIALHFSSDAYHMFNAQPILQGLNYIETLSGYFYKPLLESQYRVDVIDPSADIGQYQVVLTPLLPNLEECGLADRLKSWIENGGTWICGPLTDIRNGEASKFTHSPFGCLEEWGRIFSPYQIPYPGGRFEMAFQDGEVFTGMDWFDVYEPQAAQSVVQYTAGEFAGRAAVTAVRLGKGKVILLGTIPDGASLLKLLDKQTCATPAAQSAPNILFIPRTGVGGAVVMEYQNKAASFYLPYEATDILSGKRYAPGEIQLAPFQVMVLQK